MYVRTIIYPSLFCLPYWIELPVVVVQLCRPLCLLFRVLHYHYYIDSYDSCFPHALTMFPSICRPQSVAPIGTVAPNHRSDQFATVGCSLSLAAAGRRSFAGRGVRRRQGGCSQLPVVHPCATVGRSFKVVHRRPSFTDVRRRSLVEETGIRGRAFGFPLTGKKKKKTEEEEEEKEEDRYIESTKKSLALFHSRDR